MAQIQKGDTFTNGQQVDATRLNQLVDSSILLVGAITEQSPMPVNGVDPSDQILVNDGGFLRRTSAGSLFNSSLSATLGNTTVTSLTVPAITPAIGVDLQLNSSDQTIVTGKSFVSADGNSVTVNSTAHGLLVDAVVLIASAPTQYNGTYRISSVTTDSFVYQLDETATPTSGTLSYTKKSTIHSNGNEVIDGICVSKGNHRVDGTLYAKGPIVSTGVVNFTGTLQVNGSTAYVLYEVASLSLPAPVNISAITNSNVATTANFGAKPSDEIWVFKCRFNYLCNGYPLKIGVRYSTETIYSGNYLAIESRQDAGGGAQYAYTHFNHEWVVNQGTALAGTTLSIDISNAGGTAEIFSISKNADGIGTASWAGGSTQPPVIFIYKYKTA